MQTRGMVAAGLSIALLSLPNTGCGGKGSTALSTPASAITQTQVTAATSDFFEAMALALEANPGAPLVVDHLSDPKVRAVEDSLIRGAQGGDADLSPAVVSPRAADLSPKAATTLSSYTYNCPAGGTIVVAGSYTSTVATTTTWSITITETVTNCSDSGIVMNSSPSVTLSESGSETGNVFTDNISFAGGFTVGSTSCTVNETETATINDSTEAYSETVSGSICGITLNNTYSGTL